MKIIEKYDYKLLVEGHNDQHVVMALCGIHNITENFDIIDCKSIDHVFEQLKLRLTIPQINKKIGVIVDADINLDQRWRQFCNIVNIDTKYHLPSSVPSEGLVLQPIDSNDPVIGLWIMPNNHLNGMLEDFLYFLAPEKDPLLTKTTEVLSELENMKLHRYKDIHHAKAKIHTFLAWQEDPGTPMGQAITKRYLQPDCDLAQLFISWLKNVFV